MKSALLYGLLLLLVSCGGGGGKGGGTSTGVSTQEIKSSKELECLDAELDWLTNPPANKGQAFESMSSSKFETCGASEEVLDLYINRVMLTHTNLNF